jgi:hypothetical protein
MIITSNPWAYSSIEIVIVLRRQDAAGCDGLPRRRIEVTDS